MTDLTEAELDWLENIYGGDHFVVKFSPRTVLTMAQLISAARASLSPWREIESAPKETWILGGVSGCPHLFVIRQNHKGQWWTQDAQKSSGPTHWMPLPPAPHSNGERDDGTLLDDTRNADRGGDRRPDNGTAGAERKASSELVALPSDPELFGRPRGSVCGEAPPPIPTRGEDHTPCNVSFTKRWGHWCSAHNRPAYASFGGMFVCYPDAPSNQPDAIGEDVAGVIDYLKGNCNFWVNGRCDTLRCFRRAGYKAGSTEGFTPMCEERQAADLIERLSKPAPADLAGLVDEASKAAARLRHWASPDQTSFDRELMTGAHYIDELAAALLATARERDELHQTCVAESKRIAGLMGRIEALNEQIRKLREALQQIADEGDDFYGTARAALGSEE